MFRYNYSVAMRDVNGFLRLCLVHILAERNISVDFIDGQITTGTVDKAQTLFEGKGADRWPDSRFTAIREVVAARSGGNYCQMTDLAVQKLGATMSAYEECVA